MSYRVVLVDAAAAAEEIPVFGVVAVEEEQASLYHFLGVLLLVFGNVERERKEERAVTETTRQTLLLVESVSTATAAVVEAA